MQESQKAEMLTDDQIARVWEHLVAAEVRALYFADLTARYTRQKQVITGMSFFLSSGAAATIIGQAPAWVPLMLALGVAASTAYAVAVGLDRRIATVAKLYAAWSQIASLYDRLWNHTYDLDADAQLDALLQREHAPSELAVEANAPNDQQLLGQWQDHVLTMRHVPRPA